MTVAADKQSSPVIIMLTEALMTEAMTTGMVMLVVSVGPSTCT